MSETILPYMIYHSGDRSAFDAASDEEKEAWNKYAVAAAAVFDANPRLDSYGSHSVYPGWDRDGKVTSWCPPKYFPEWLIEYRASNSIEAVLQQLENSVSTARKFLTDLSVRVETVEQAHKASTDDVIDLADLAVETMKRILTEARHGVFKNLDLDHATDIIHGALIMARANKRKS